MGRRGNGEGSITKRKDGLYMARYWVETPAGPKRKRSTERRARSAKPLLTGSRRHWATAARG